MAGTPKGEGFLYKAQGERGKRGILLAPAGASKSPPTVTLADGSTLTGKYINTLHGRHQFLFGTAILGQKDVTLTYNGSTSVLADTNRSYETDSPGDGWTYRNKGDLGQASGGGGAAPGQGAFAPIGSGYQPGSNFGGGFGGGQAAPTFTDAASLEFGQIAAQPIPMPNYQPIDPRVYTQEQAAINSQQYLNNLQLSQAAAMGFASTEQQINNSFAPAQSALQQGLVGQENQFNQGQVANANQFNPGQVSQANSYNRGELAQAIDSSGLPIRDTVSENLDRARQLSKGFLPTTIEDRAFEMAARSKAGDALVSKGLGTGSFLQSAIDKYTIGERLNLAQQGSADAQNWLNQGVKLLVDSPIKYNPLLSSPLTAKVSQDVRGMTSFSPGGAQQAEQGNINTLTTQRPGESLQTLDVQKQFRANLENQTNMFNSSQGVAVAQYNNTGNFQQQLTQLNNDQQSALLSYNFAQNVANYVNSQYQQQLANYGYSQGFGQQPGSAQSGTPQLGSTQRGGLPQSGVAPSSSLGTNPSTSTVFTQR